MNDKFMGENIPGGNFLGGKFTRGSLIGMNFPYGNFPDGSFPDTFFDTDIYYLRKMILFAEISIFSVVPLHMEYFSNINAATTR